MITQTPYQGTIITLWTDEIDNLDYLVRHFGLKFGIELGTYKGGSAKVMIDAGVDTLYTYDNQDFLELKDERGIYRIADIWCPEITEEIKELCKRAEQKILFCDNGNKARELNTFGPCLNAGDILAAHDYPIEFKDQDVSAMVSDNNYERVPLPKNNRIIAWRKI